MSKSIIIGSLVGFILGTLVTFYDHNKRLIKLEQQQTMRVINNTEIKVNYEPKY